MCPFCKEKMTPDITQENNLRRDKCKYTKCEQNIYICRSPGCKDYSRGGDIYDDEFCMACSDKLAEFGKDATHKIGTATVLAGTALVTKRLADLSKKNKDHVILSSTYITLILLRGPRQTVFWHHNTVNSWEYKDPARSY